MTKISLCSDVLPQCDTLIVFVFCSVLSLISFACKKNKIVKKIPRLQNLSMICARHKKRLVGGLNPPPRYVTLQSLGDKNIIFSISHHKDKESVLKNSKKSYIIFLNTFKV